MEAKEKYAFISYSSKNQQMADSVRMLFQEMGIPCWMAPYDIPAGSKYAFVINDALENCACLVLLLTNASQESQFVEREIERAITYGKPIIPMQLEHLQLNSGFKFYIGNSQIIAVPEIRADAPEFRKVLAGIRQFVGVPEPRAEENKKELPAIVKRALAVEQIASRWVLQEITSAGRDAVLMRLHDKVHKRVCCDLMVITVHRSQGHVVEDKMAHAWYLRELAEKKATMEEKLRDGEQLRREGSVVTPLEVVFHEWEEDGTLGCDLLLRYEPLTPLRQLLGEGETFSEDQIVKIGTDISRALTAFARLGMAPPEVSPDSVCLGRYGTYKLLQSVFTEKESGSGVCSLGGVLSRLTEQGKKLHDPKGIHRGSGISRGLRRILNKACNPDPAARYESAEEFREALQNMNAQDHRTPSILQRDVLECGAASLAMIFAYWGKNMTLDQLCAETNVSPDGCNAGDIMRAAKRFGMDCHGYRREPEQLLQTEMPCILHWDFNHFLVLEDIEDGIAYLNDPASGHKEITMEELDLHFTGVVLTFRPTEQW